MICWKQLYYLNRNESYPCLWNNTFLSRRNSLHMVEEEAPWSGPLHFGTLLRSDVSSSRFRIYTNCLWRHILEGILLFKTCMNPFLTQYTAVGGRRYTECIIHLDLNRICNIFSYSWSGFEALTDLGTHGRIDGSVSSFGFSQRYLCRTSPWTSIRREPPSPMDVDPFLYHLHWLCCHRSGE